MSLPDIPDTKLTVHEMTEVRINLLPENCQFWPEAVPDDDDGSTAYYRLNFDDTNLNSALLRMKLYPVGLEDFPAQKPPIWSDKDKPTFHSHAMRVRHEIH